MGRGYTIEQSNCYFFNCYYFRLIVHIDIYTNDLSNVTVMFNSLLKPQYLKQTIKMGRLLYWELLLYILLLYWYCIIVGNSGTTFQKTSAIYCNYYHYGSSSLTDVYTYHLLLGFHGRIYVEWKKFKNINEAPFGIPVACTERKTALRVKPIVDTDLCFCWKSAGTLLTKLMQYCNQSVLSW